MDIQPDLASMLLERLGDVPEWMERGSCRDTELDPMFEDDYPEFLKMCGTCPVQPQCREYFENKYHNVRPIQFGVGGGILFDEYHAEQLAKRAGAGDDGGS